VFQDHSVHTLRADRFALVSELVVTLDVKTGLLTGLLVGKQGIFFLAGKQGWKCPVSLLETCCGFKSLNVMLIQALRRVKQDTKGEGWRNVPHNLCIIFQTCRRIGVYLSSEEHLHRSLTRPGLG
jgi:hypothetical protein